MKHYKNEPESHRVLSVDVSKMVRFSQRFEVKLRNNSKRIKLHFMQEPSLPPKIERILLIEKQPSNSKQIHDNIRREQK